MVCIIFCDGRESSKELAFYCGWTGSLVQTPREELFFPLTFPLYQSLIPSVYPFIFISNTFSFLKKHDVNPSLNEKNPSLNHDVCYVQWYMAKYQYFNCQTLLSTLGLAFLLTPIHKNVMTYLYSFNTTSQCCCSFTNSFYIVLELYDVLIYGNGLALVHCTYILLSCFAKFASFGVEC